MQQIMDLYREWFQKNEITRGRSTGMETGCEAIEKKQWSKQKGRICKMIFLMGICCCKDLLSYFESESGNRMSQKEGERRKLRKTAKKITIEKK